MHPVFRNIVSLAAGLTLLCSAAMADELVFTGKVGASRTVEVYAPIGGTVESVLVEAGQQVTEDTVLCTLKTNKIYASEDGTITGIFGQPGDNTADVAAKYGAVLYVEGHDRYSVTASTKDAYNSSEANYVHAGETVYLVSRSDRTVTGVGVINAVSGANYTIEVKDGSFMMDAAVNVFRSPDFDKTSQLGRGTVGRSNPLPVTGTGAIVSIAVKDGQAVQRGDLLMETLDGSFDGLYMSGAGIYADVNGVISQLNCMQGSPVQKGGVVAVVYPMDAMRIEGSINETDISNIHIGDKVSIELNWNSDTGKTYEGVITAVSSLGDVGPSGDVTYKVYISFTPDEDTRYGMTAVITTGED